LFGRSVVMRELFGYLGRVAPAPLDVLVYGESGTGKELTARTIHQLSPRHDKPFITLDCSSLPSTLADATLFGFRRGAFTGADRDQAGLFEQADGGTLFIDELGELSAELQAKFLRALDRREFSRLGEPGTVCTVDVRVVAATNRNLEEDIAKGAFRADLYHRVRQSIVRLPSLRDRGLDVVLIGERLLAGFAAEHDLRVTLGEDAKVAMLAYQWPGNVRELKNTVKQAAFTSKGPIIGADDLQLGRDTQWTRRIAEALADGDRQYEEMHLLVDRNFLPRVLEATGSIKGAAKRLGVTRDRLRSRLRVLGLYEVGGD
jgi:transcriptional regulator with GAF, ATPase, and Fis domain